MLAPEPAGQRGVGGLERAGLPAWPQRAQGIEDDGHVDALLQQGARDGGQQARGGRTHRDQGHGHPGEHALQGDPPCPAGNGHDLAEPVDAVDGEHCVGSLRGGGGAPRAHGDADIGQGQCGSVIDAVADHDDRPADLLGTDGVQLLAGALREHAIDADDGADCLGDLGAVPGHHDDAVDSAGP